MLSHDRHDHDDLFHLRQLPPLPPRFRPPIFGSAQLASEEDLRTYLNAPDECYPSAFPEVSLLLERPDGRSYSAVYQQPLYLSSDVRQKAILAVGQIGAGKTERVLTPLLIGDIANPHASVVAVCTKGDLHQRLAPFVERWRMGVKILVINFTDPARTTHAWNLFGHDNPDTALRDAEEFCQAAEKNGSRFDSPFWDNNAARLITAVRLALKKKYGATCPADVHETLESPQSELLGLLAANSDVPFAAGCHAFHASGSHNAETVLATAQGCMRCLRDNRLAAVTSAAEFHYDQLFNEPTVLIMEIRQGDLETVRPMVNAFFTGLFRAICEFAEGQPGCRLPRPLCVYLDDFAASVGKVPQCGQYLNLLRSRDVRVTAAVQTLKQFEQFYGPGEAAAVIAAFNTKIFVSPVELFDARWASEQSGVCTVAAVQSISDTSDFANDSTERSRTVAPVARALLLPEEVRLGPKHVLLGRAATVFFPDAPPFQAWFRPAYEIPAFAGTLAKAAKSPRSPSLRSNPLTRSPLAGLPALAAPSPETSHMSYELIRSRLESIKTEIHWHSTTGSARDWWANFEEVNSHRLELVLRVAEELAKRKATITDFFLAYVYSNTDNIQANLHYLDYIRLKMAEERRKKEESDQNDFGKATEMYNANKVKLKFAQASREAQGWWKELEVEYEDDLWCLYDAVANLTSLQVTIDFCFNKAMECGVFGIEDLVSLLED